MCIRDRRTITREQAGSSSRHSQSQLVKRLAGHVSSPSRVAQKREALQQLQQAVDRLAAEDQELLFLRYVEQLSPPEAGAVLGIKPNTFSKRHMRVLQKLRKLLITEP